MNSSHKSMCTFKNLGNQPGKTPMWRNPTRDILFSIRKVISIAEIQFSSKRNHLQPHKTAPTICCLGKCAQRLVWPIRPCWTAHRKLCHVPIVWTTPKITPNDKEKYQTGASICVQQCCLKNNALFLCCMDYTDPCLQISSKLQHFLTAKYLGICAQSP
jgi:hypothetical protein